MPHHTTLLMVMVGVLLSTINPPRGKAQALIVDPHDDACLNTAALQARVARWLEGKPIDTDVRITVYAAALPPWFSLERSDGSSAERRFEDLPQTCPDRLDAISLAIAIALEQPIASPALVDTAPELVVTPPPPSPPLDTPGDTITRNDRLRLHAALAWLHHIVPTDALGFGAGIEAPVSPQLRLMLTGLLVASARVPVGSAAADATFVSTRGLLCVAPWDAAVSFEVCGGTWAGLLFAAGSGSGQDQSTVLGAVMALGRIALRWPANSAFSLRLSLDGALHLLRPRLVVEATPPVSTVTGILGGATSLEAIVSL